MRDIFRSGQLRGGTPTCHVIRDIFLRPPHEESDSERHVMRDTPARADGVHGAIGAGGTPVLPRILLDCARRRGSRLLLRDSLLLPRAAAADAHRNVRLATEQHQRLRIAAILEKVNELGMEPRPAPLEKLVEPRHLIGDGLAIRRLDGSEEEDKGFFDLVLHQGGWANRLCYPR